MVEGRRNIVSFLFRFVLFFVFFFLVTQRCHSRRIKCINNNNNKNVVKSSLSTVAQLGFVIDKLNTWPRYIGSFRDWEGFEWKLAYCDGRATRLYLRALGTAVYVVLKFIVLLETVKKIKYYPVRKSLFYEAEIKLSLWRDCAFMSSRIRTKIKMSMRELILERDRWRPFFQFVCSGTLS